MYIFLNFVILWSWTLFFFYQHVQTNYLHTLEISFQESRLKVSEQIDASLLTHTNTQRCLLVHRRLLHVRAEARKQADISLST